MQHGVMCHIWRQLTMHDVIQKVVMVQKPGNCLLLFFLSGIINAEETVVYPDMHQKKSPVCRQYCFDTSYCLCCLANSQNSSIYYHPCDDNSTVAATGFSYKHNKICTFITKSKNDCKQTQSHFHITIDLNHTAITL